MIFPQPTYSVQADPKNEIQRMSYEIFTNDCYFPAFANKVIIDVGACVGLFSMYAYKFAKTIYAIEPHPTNYANLVANIKNNKLDNIKPFNYAIAEKNGDGWISDKGSLEGSVFNFDKGDYPIQARTLDTFFTENKIKYADIVKMDIEGYEMKVFTEESFKNVSKKIGCIIAEVHGVLDFPVRDFIPQKIHGYIWLYHR